MSVAGSIVQGIGSLLTGFGQNSAGRSKNEQLRKGALQARQEAGIASTMTLEQGQRQAGDLIVNAAASGGGTGGSALTVLSDLERQISFQARNTVISGENRARQLEYEGAVAKRQGVIAENLGFLNAGASFLNGADQGQNASAAVNAAGA